MTDEESTHAPQMQQSGNQRRLLTRNTLQLFIGRMALFICGYPIAIILARELGPAAYGVYGIILSVLVWIEQIGAFGATSALTKLTTESEDKGQQGVIESSGLILMLILSLLLFGICWMVAPWLARLFQIPQATDLFRVAIIDVPCSGIYFAYQGILGGRRAFGALSGGMICYGLAKLVGIVIALLLGISIFWALIINIGATVAGLSFLAIYAHPAHLRLSMLHMKRIVRLALPIGLYFVVSLILVNLDFWSLKVIGAVRNEVVGIYAAALNVAKLPDLASSTISDVLFPSAATLLTVHDRDRGRRYVQDAGRMLLLILLPVTTAFALTAEELLIFLYARAYAEGASVLVLQVVALALFGVARAYSGMLIAQGKPYLATGLACLVIPVAIGSNVALVPAFGAMGAATALVSAALCATLMTGLALWRQFGSLIRPATCLRGLVATAVMALLAHYLVLTGPWLLLKYVLLLGVYGGVLTVLREVDAEDVAALALWRQKQV